MVQSIGLADYAAALGLLHPDVELAMVDEELATIVLYPDTLDALRRARETGATFPRDCTINTVRLKHSIEAE